MPNSLSRRRFVGVGGASFFALTARKSYGYASESRSVTIHTLVEGGTIRPELHGHFAEHLGSCIYGGLWVGKNSPLADENGFRKQAVRYLKELGIPVLRWPGGCFADDYHWRDGIGPEARRPKRVNIWWGAYTEDNSFGTHEFVALCRAIGAEPYFAGNVGSGSPKELRDWVEYCNYPSGSTLSEERAANGNPQPFGVRYWGVGNENWGCGGTMTAEEYCALYRQFATYVRPFGGAQPYLIACGPNSHDLDWSRRFMQAMEAAKLRRRPDGFSMHFYSGGKNTPLAYTVENMREQLSSFARMEQAVSQQRALLDTYDPERKMGLLIDEWGVWDRMIPEEEKRLGRLFQQNTIRSAVAAAMGLNVFHRQADKLVMCNIAQTVNVLHAMLLTDREKCIRTPSYWAFQLAAPHRAKTAVRLESLDTSPLGLSAAASRQGNQLVLTLANPKHDAGVKLECALAGSQAVSAQARLLHHEDFNAANTFDAPDRIVPRDHAVTVNGATLAIELPPMSVATVVARLA
jgi:alpha-L-arabinofuranosidase